MQSSSSVHIETIHDNGARFRTWLPQLCQLTHQVMSEPPYNMSVWPIGDPRSDSYSNGSIHGMWHRLLAATVRNGGGLVIATTAADLVGYGHCFCLDAEQIEYFSLAHQALAVKAQPGDWLLTFAGLAPEFRGLKYCPESGGCVPPSHAPAARSLYGTLTDYRLRLSPNSRFFIRAHPEKKTVHEAALKVGFQPIGEFTTMQGGTEQPKVVFTRPPQ